MNARAATPPEPADTGVPDAWERALLDEQLAMLGRLAEMGMAIAGAIQQRATAPEAADTVVQHAAMDFARVSRAVRMTLALQSRLVRDFKTPPKAGSANDDDDDIEPGSLQVVWVDPEDDGEAERICRVQADVRRAAKSAGLDGETVERLEPEARERLERDDIYTGRPYDEIVATICEELGLAGGGEGSLHLPREAAGGGPLAEERAVEGAGGYGPPFNSPPSDLARFLDGPS